MLLLVTSREINSESFYKLFDNLIGLLHWCYILYKFIGNPISNRIFATFQLEDVIYSLVRDYSAYEEDRLCYNFTIDGRNFRINQERS